MRFSVHSDVLVQELRLLAKVVPVKSSIPALGYIRVDAAEGGLRLAATDLSVVLRTPCAARVEEHGGALLPARRSLELLEQIDAAEVAFAVDGDGHVRVDSGAFRSRLQAMHEGDFPQLPQVEGDVAVVSALALKMLIDRTVYAIGNAEQKFTIDGALLSLNGAVAAMVATDGRRLSVATATRPTGPPLSTLVPRKTMEVLSPLLNEGDVEISQGERHLFFTVGPRTLVSRVLETKFPQYDRAIPRDCDKHAVVDRAALASALRRVGVVAGEHDEVIFDISEGEVRLTTRDAGIGDAEESLGAACEGDPVKVCMPSKSVIDFLDRASSKTVRMSFKSAATPLLLTDGDFLNVVLVKRQ